MQMHMGTTGIIANTEFAIRWSEVIGDLSANVS